MPRKAIFRNGIFVTLLLLVTGTVHSQTTNVGLEVRFGFQSQGGRVAFIVQEARQGNTDLNGDGDTNDRVLHVFDTATRSTTNLRISLAGDYQLQGSRVAFSASEFGQGNADLNGDGDTADSVLAIFDAATGATINTGLDARNIQLEGDLVAFAASESSQGNTDLNGDRDTGDNVLHVINLANGETTNVGLSANSIQLQANRVAFYVSEASQGNTDLNGDGDKLDAQVLHVFDAAREATTNTHFSAAGPEAFREDRIAFTVWESMQGASDFNGDGDANDFVLHVFDAASGVSTNVGLHATAFQVKSDRIAFTVDEGRQGNTDLNGDGDTSDQVLHVFDMKNGTVINAGLHTLSGITLEGERVALAVGESNQGGADLNGDGDTNDTVLHVFNAGNAVITNIGLNACCYQLVGDWLRFVVGEAAQANTDLNGDGDTNDGVVHLLHAATGAVVNTGFAFTLNSANIQLSGDRAAFPVTEATQGNADLNADGDTADRVLHLFDAVTHTVTNTGLAVLEIVQLQGDHLSLDVTESGQGNNDLNGDGDTSDLVLHVLSFAARQIKGVGTQLQGIIDQNPGTPLADRAASALAGVQNALTELTKIPPENKAALGSIKAAEGELKSAVKDGLLDATLGGKLMKALAGAARQLAQDAIDRAIAEDGDPGDISEAQASFTLGNALLTAEEYKDAVDMYKQALSKAEASLH